MYEIFIFVNFIIKFLVIEDKVLYIIVGYKCLWFCKGFWGVGNVSS